MQRVLGRVNMASRHDAVQFEQACNKKQLWRNPGLFGLRLLCTLESKIYVGTECKMTC